MDTTVDAEWEALFNLPADDIAFDFTALKGPLDSDGFDSPLVYLSGQSSGQSTPGDGQHALHLENSLQTLLDNTVPVDVTNSTPPTPKSGGRFSKEVVRMLRNWLNAHKARPYPSNEEMELLQQRTGLNKTQISNWFANARRPDTPAPRHGKHYLNPMERWQSSPPEHEPAAASDIARAVESNGGVPLST
jgi:hypothetical protein